MAARRLPGARRLRSRCALAASTLPCAWAFAPSAWPSPAVRVLGRVPVEPASCFGFCLPQRGLTPPAAAPLPDTLVSGSFRAFGFTAGPLATLVRAGPRPCVEDFLSLSLSLSLFLYLSLCLSLALSSWCAFALPQAPAQGGGIFRGSRLPESRRGGAASSCVPGILFCDHLRRARAPGAAVTA